MFILFFKKTKTKSIYHFQTMTDVVGNPEEERRAEYFYEPWTSEGVNRYFYSLV